MKILNPDGTTIIVKARAGFDATRITVTPIHGATENRYGFLVPASDTRRITRREAIDAAFEHAKEKYSIALAHFAEN